MIFIKKHRYFILMAVDLAIVFASYLLVYLLMDIGFDQVNKSEVLSLYMIIAVLGIHFATFFIFRIYAEIWRYAKAKQLIKMITAVFTAEVVLSIIFYSSLSSSIIFFTLEFIVSSLLLLFSRIAYMIIYSHFNDKFGMDYNDKKKRLMIIGAGFTGSMFLSDYQKGRYRSYEPICFIDDDLAKQGRYLNGIKILGSTNDIVSICKRENIDVILLCITTISEKNKKRILDICAETNCHVSKMIVGVDKNISSTVQKISIEDLLGREPVEIDDSKIDNFIGGKVVLVTGGGGSIGSELCRQIATHNPNHLIILDIYENNAYEIELELKRAHVGKLNLTVEIASVRDKAKMRYIIDKYRPDIIYHAAAHKHVPLMEHNPEESVKNNVIGTHNVATLAIELGVKRFILVSTDKAVNPTNIMGATKRCCEMLVQAMNSHSQTDFVAVRFGNVIGSNGSVIPLFVKQIHAGGPVTVTHPDIIRYFITIPEAVRLLLTCGNVAKGGEIFVLDMGEPVKILDLAKQMIRLSGLSIGNDIEIKFTGLRPGEKLYEELLLDEEGINWTENKKIFIGSPINFDVHLFFEKLAMLEEAAMKNDDEKVRALIAEIVPTYHKENK